MADSVVTSAFVDGRWRNQPTTLREIIEANSKRRQAAEPQRLVGVPSVGILSRTVIQSPTVNWIAPGQIRNELKNDIVFVGEDFVHIKEIISGGHLRHVGTKSDFGAPIRAAKMLGQHSRKPLKDPSKFERPVSEQDLDLEDIPFKIEQVERSAAGETQVPPQVLLLTTELHDLQFLFAHQSSQETLNFETFSMPLMKGKSSLESPGKYLAIDPYSRAVAVGAHQGIIVLYRAKKLENLREQFRQNPQEWAPFIDERAIKIPGAILKMDFLFPEKDDRDHVILLVVYRNLDQGARIVWKYFEWNHTESLNFLKEGQPLPIGKRKTTINSSPG